MRDKPARLHMFRPTRPERTDSWASGVLSELISLPVSKFRYTSVVFDVIHGVGSD